MITDFGQIKSVDLREGWPNEAQDFTPWLEQHISLLGDALGLELEVQEREAPVGGFSLDLLARDLGRNKTVVIENQLTATDHVHLGQVLTYGAGFDAGAVIWLARTFRDEHRQAIDWLNQHTGEGVEFFGVEIQLLRIDESKLAPNFKLVATPNQWTKEKRQGVVGGTSEKQEKYRSFFQGLIDELREQHGFTGARKAQPQSWYYFASGFAKVNYGFSFAEKGRARVELYIDRDKEWNERAYDELESDKKALESGLEEGLQWERLDNNKACRISVVRTGTIEDDAEALEGIRKWSVLRLLRFKDVFGPRLQNLPK